MIANPLSQDVSAMRSSSVPSMLRALRWNLDRDQVDVRFFEFGKIYRLRADGSPEERRVLTLGATGHRRPASVYDNERLLDFFDLKGDLETICAAFDLPECDFQPFRRPYIEKGQSGQVTSQGETLAVFGQLQQDVAREYKLRPAVWVAEIDLELLLDFSLRSRKFRPFSKFPAVERDFSLVVPTEVPYSRLSAAVTGLAIEEIRGFRPVDYFPERHSLLLRVTFQSPSRTLTSEEVEGLGERLLAALAPLGVRLRG